MEPDTFLGKTPRELGYHMPAEWEKHDAIWLSWPHDPTTFPLRVDKAEETYVQIIKLIHQTEHVNLFVKNPDMEQKATGLLKENAVNLGRVRFFKFDYADVWFRDYGPTFVVDQHHRLAMVRWIFNSWGEKYDELLKDRRITPYMNQQMQLPCFEPEIVLEGGSIDVNGAGTLLTTEQCLLNPNRNPALSKTEIEGYLKSYLGVSRVLWLNAGIVGDDTDGHIDDIARFVNPTTVLCAYEEDPNDENYAALKENYELLRRAVDQDGNNLQVVKLPMPCALGDNAERLPASYTNFYIGNSVVLVPVFSHKNDKRALSIIQEWFPDRKVAGVNCNDLVHGLGTLHCISQQQPTSNFKWTQPPKP
ncbi:MAG: agmatine deiminase family protein [Candidatus Bathyarchaeota archaeon]|nr:agmatine deiminase family protein [Candidatus Bathyarchaeota archaeon]